MYKKIAVASLVVSCFLGLPLKSFVRTSSAKSCVAVTEFDRAIKDWRSGKIDLQVSARLMTADGGQQVEYTSAGPAQIFIGRLTIPSPTDWERPVHTWTVVLISDNILQRWQPPSSPLWEAVPRRNALPETGHPCEASPYHRVCTVALQRENPVWCSRALQSISRGSAKSVCLNESGSLANRPSISNLVSHDQRKLR